jgi:D-amino-acid dehydrogenase
MAKIIIIGGGINGLMSAYYLQKQGHEITVIDKSDFQDNCSYGNAGMIVPSHFVPLATPGMLSQGIRWMFNSKSPFYVRPSLNPQLISWGLKFVKKATHKHVAASALPLKDLSLLSRSLFIDLENEPGFDFELKKNGILAFFKTEKAGEEEAHMVQKAKEIGLDMEMLSAEQCKALQPNLNIDVLGAAYYKDDAHLYPYKLMQQLLAHLQSNGVKLIKNREITGFEIKNGKIISAYSGQTSFEADQFVLATGSWSPAVAKLLNLNISLMPGKGYSFMVNEPENRMTIPALLCEARVAITPMNGQLRYGGTMELDKINSRINMNRVKGIVESVPKYFKDLHPAVPAEKDIWFGFRPSSPDGLPYIGRSKKLNNLVVATGHGMMGLSLGAATGLLVSQLVSGTKTELDTAPFSLVK